jgi:hypothetical protein
MFTGRHYSSFDLTPDPSDFVLLYCYGKFVRKSKKHALQYKFVQM